jgi:hypothetical protein
MLLEGPKTQTHVDYGAEKESLWLAQCGKEDGGSMDSPISSSQACGQILCHHQKLDTALFTFYRTNTPDMVPVYHH